MSTPPRTVEQMWEIFAEAQLAPDLSPTLLVELKRAYYCGAAALLSVYDAAGQEGVNMDAAIQVLDEVEAEVDAFITAIREGRS